MDKYYGNVCELDIIFNFQKAYFILDELLLAGEMQESSKKNVLRCISQQDSLEDMEVCGGFLSSDRFQSSTCWPTSTPEHTLWHMIVQLNMYEHLTMTDIIFRSQVTDDGVTKIM